jgi:hypothetical protein
LVRYGLYNGQLKGIFQRPVQECLTYLEQKLDSDELEKIKNHSDKDLYLLHFGLGMWIRNNLGLWEDSALSLWLSYHGIDFADDISGVIINCFWRYLNGLPVDTENPAAYR